jgi:SAM-dependent methyltransferase
MQRTAAEQVSTQEESEDSEVKHVSRGHQEVFCKSGAAQEWDQVVFGSDTYYSFIWELQRQALEDVVRGIAKERQSVGHLDFACGTGRVLHALAPLVTDSVGLDISNEMAAAAAAKVPRATVKVGDILEEPDLLDADYDIITAFRFFLNTRPEIRQPILTSLAEHLRDEHSRIVFNVQGNTWSLEGITTALDSSSTTMSHADVRDLTRAAGLVVERWSGFGVCPASREHLQPLQPWLRRVDRWAARKPWLKHVSRDLLFVCRQRG